MSLYRTYRPKTFEEVVGQEHVTETIKQQIIQDALSHAYLFCGPRGVGKTTTARLIAHAANCQQRDGYRACGECPSCKTILDGNAMDIIEIDAASHTGVDNVRENIIENVRFAPNQLRKKVFIIDEVHMLSKGAFNALLKTLEEPPAHALFILATTELHKIPETIVSRCQRFDFRTIPEKAIVGRLEGIAKKEGVKIDADVLREVARRSEGCLRDAESLLGTVLTVDKKHITAEAASVVLPMGAQVIALDFLEALAKKQAALAFSALRTLTQKGSDTRLFADASIELLRHMVLARMQESGLEDRYTDAQLERANSIADALSTSDMTSLLHKLVEAREALGSYHVPELPLELLIVEHVGARVGAVADGPGAQAVAEPPVQEQVAEAVANIEPVVVATAEVVVEQPSKPNPEQAEEAVQTPKEVAKEGSIDLERVQKVWPTFLKSLRERHASLPLALELSEPIRVDGNVVSVRVQFEFYAETVNQPKNNGLLAEILSESCGTSLGLQGVFSNVKDEEDVGAILNAFGGEVVG